MKNFRPLVWLLAITLFFQSCSENGEDPISGELPAIDILDAQYGSNPVQSLNVYLPAGRSSGETPLLIYIHGGAWIDGDKSEFDSFRALAETYFPDYAYISIGYRLYDIPTGNNAFPSQEEDILEAIEYIVSKTAEWNVSNEIVLSGASAGGHLALLHAYKHNTVGNIKSLIALFPPTELSELFEFNVLTQLGLTQLLGGTPETVPGNYSDSSPISFIGPQSIPTIFFHGTEDTVVPISQSEILKDELESANVDHEFVIIEGQGHGFAPLTYAEAFEQAAAFSANYIQ